MEHPVDYHPRLPERHDHGIAIVGCGGIVSYAHLPAYRSHGLRVLGCHDIDPVAAEALAEQWELPRVYRSLEELLADDEVEIVDIAVQPDQQRPIAEAALAGGKHLLCQKPLAAEYSDAEAIVDAADAAGRKVSVNQQMRWDGGIAASKILIGEQRAVGEVTDAQVLVSVETPWHMWPWLAASPRLELTYHSIHYLDSLRFLFGDPELVTTRLGRFPGQAAVGETKTLTVLEYASGLQALVAVNHFDLSGDHHATFRFLGTEGAISGTIGLLYDYPDGRPDTLEIHVTGEDEPEIVPIDTMWIPDAFIGPMASLMDAIETGGEPITAAHDNLKTLQLVEAAYLSAAENRSISLDEIRSRLSRR